MTNKDHNDGYNHSTKNHCCEQLLMGGNSVTPNSEMMETLPPGQIEQQHINKMTGDNGRQNNGEMRSEEAKQRKKAQETLFDISWAVGKFLLILFSCFC